MAHANAKLIERFYAALGRGDGDAMASCYARDARFSDPAFGELRDAEPGAMWRMLCSRPSGLEVELVEHDADANTGSARWVARYTFTDTGRRVVNDVCARFVFADGLIAEQRDEFDFHRWARQALGPAGLLLGWTPLLRRAVQRKARAALHAYITEH